MTLNIGTGVVTTFDDLVTLAKRLLPKLEVEVVPGERLRSARQPMVIDKAREVLGWVPEYDIEGGFQDYIGELRELG